MSDDRREIVLFRIDRKTGLLILAALAVAFGGFALAQQLTLTASYPVPSGIYNQLITTGNSGAVPANTVFNRNAGNTILVPPTNASGQVGIGTTSPQSSLDVNGGVRIGDTAAACAAANAGTVRYDSGQLQYCNGSAWTAMGGGVPGQLYGLCWQQRQAPSCNGYGYGCYMYSSGGVLTCNTSTWCRCAPGYTEVVTGGSMCANNEYVSCAKN